MKYRQTPLQLIILTSIFLLTACVSNTTTRTNLADSSVDEDRGIAGITSTSVTSPSQQRRVALVIGNGAYRKAPLANPGNDADLSH